MARVEASALRRRGARLAVAMLVALVSLAVYAPFVANDRPLLLCAVDRGAYAAALRALAPVAASWNERLLAAADAREEGDGPRVDELRRELRALELRLATLRRFAPSEPDALRPIVEIEQLARAWTEAVVRDLRRPLGPEEAPGPASTRYGEAARVRELALGLQRSHAGLELRERTWSPLAASLAWTDWAFVLAWTAVLVLAARRARPRSFAIGLAASLALAPLVRAGFAVPPALATGAIKDGLRSGELTASRAWFAPVPFGPAETNLGEAFRAPTWTATSRIDEPGRSARDDGLAPESAPRIARPGEPDAGSALRHPLGTDSLGRDVLARLIWGARVSLAVGFASVALAFALGTLAGGLAGYFRGKLDAAILAVIAVLQSFPAFFVILVAVALLPARGLHPQAATIAVIGAVGWTGIARLVRAECLRTGALEYVLAARTLGFSHARVLARHVLPNSLAPAIVAAAFAVTTAILIESATSFLGFGVRPPTPSWGAVLRESQSSAHWWILVFPGLVVFATCLACNRIGDALRDALDPREAP
jgi:peptide/nickel transport system permease protein